MADPPDSRPPGAAPPDVDSDAPDFDPVPLRHRRDGWTPDKQRRYVALLFKTGLAGAAARAVGMTPQSAKRLRLRPDAASFDAACAAAHGSARARWARLRREEAERFTFYFRHRGIG